MMDQERMDSIDESSIYEDFYEEQYIESVDEVYESCLSNEEWLTAEGVRLEFNEIDYAHLMNIISYLEDGRHLMSDVLSDKFIRRLRKELARRDNVH